MVLIIKLLVIPFANLRKRFKLTKLLMFHFAPQYVKLFNILCLNYNYLLISFLQRVSTAFYAFQYDFYPSRMSHDEPR